MSPKSASSWLTIDLAAIAANYAIFKNKAAKGCEAASVIKADGYGLGVDKVLAALENQNCPYYFVATLDEAIHVRSFTQKPIAVLGGLYLGNEDLYVRENITPVLNSYTEIFTWSEQCALREVKLPAIIHIDTGMNRLGLEEQEIKKLTEQPEIIEKLDLNYLMSHLACADEKDHEMNELQYERFQKACSAFPNAKKSLANSSGCFRSDKYHFDLLRPGMALYGLNPTPEAKNPMSAVVKLETRILQIRDVKKGQTVGYGATHSFESDTTLATIALGYADGFLRSLSSNGSLYFKGQSCPIVGRVSMDLVSVDIGSLKDKPNIGDVLEIIGPNQDADALAKSANTIGYEILTDLGGRYHKKYL